MTKPFKFTEKQIEARKKISEALNHYKEAVKINPNSNEAGRNSAKFEALLKNIDDVE